MRGNPVWQPKILLQPGVFGLAKGFNCHPRISTPNNRTNRYRDDVDQKYQLTDLKNTTSSVIIWVGVVHTAEYRQH